MSALPFPFSLLDKLISSLEGERQNEVEDVWVNSAPTITPDDKNTNPIFYRETENGFEFYRKHK